MSYENEFHAAVALQQQGKLDEALTAYQKILDEGQQHTSNLTEEQASAVSHNISVVYLKKNATTKALIYNEKALLLNPSSKMARSLKEQAGLTSVAQIPHEISFYENLNNSFLNPISLEILFLFLLATLTLSLQEIFKWFLQKKQERLENLSRQGLRWTLPVFVVLFTLCCLLFYMKWSDENQLKAIISADSVTVQTGPGGNQPTIMTLEAGAVVEVLRLFKQQNGTYVQIKYPGAFSGWVKQSDLELANSVRWN